MEVIVGKTAGFCYGVKRAVDGCLDEIEKNQDEKIYCLGEIVHNKQVIKDLEEKGIIFINDLNDIDNIKNIKDINTKIIIRAHGIDKKIYELAKEKNLETIDYTCPNVIKIHKIAEDYEKQGYYIFLTGSKEHPEMIGTASYCGNNYSIIEKEEDLDNALENFKKSNINKLLVISQTTYSMKKFESIKNILEKRIPNSVDLVIKNTICLATETRQKDTKELSKEADAMIIIGGKNSSNTKKLYEIALENCKNSICIETKEELNIEQYKNRNIKKIGIMAGASTPEKSINDVIDILKLKIK